MMYPEIPNRLAIEYRPIEAITPFSSNPRKHSRAQIRKLQASLAAFGWTNPLIVDDANNLICGHGRLMAAMDLGMSEVPVVDLGQMSEADRRAYIIADNRLAEDAQWSKELLRSELSGLIELGYEVELTGFDTFEIDGILSFDDTGDADQEDRVDLPDDDAAPIAQIGDLWHIGDQRMAVGDCRDVALIERLLEGNRVRLIQTDPPYGCRIANNVSGNGRVKHSDFGIGSGETSLPEMAMTLLRPAFKAITPHCHPGAIAFVWTDWRASPHMLDAAQGVFHELKNQIVWVKDPGMGGFYRSAYELCLAFKVSRGAHTSNIALGRRNRSNVWRYPGANTFRKGRLQDLADHPTIKNRRMIADAILDVTKPGDVVFDGFCGSGTTLVASAMTGRRGFGIELDPKYADVILRRVSEATGCEPQLDGEVPLSQVAAERAGGRS
ncbi:site-specific DNA-methyltransferase [Tsuneonella mangrovi]|uniref:site-specific DNA-methyltransferase n=1 Tax=Tsuneonella mangrovi TaxID=1982042 RepID=UPI001F0B3843|nr:DNA methyltransferase [Tsuneonella mangrovi]